MSRERRVPRIDRNDKRVVEMLRLLRETVRERTGDGATFEEESLAAMAVMRDVLELGLGKPLPRRGETETVEAQSVAGGDRENDEAPRTPSAKGRP
jgi:hypothetical protein